MAAPQALVALGDAPSLSDVGRVVAANYGIYHEVAARLEALQEWIKGMDAAW